MQVQRAFGQNVYARRMENDEMTPGGIVLPTEIMYEKNIWCELISVGEGLRINEHDEEGTLTGVRRLPATEAKVGDKVLIRQFDGEPISMLDDKHFLAKGRAVEGIYSNDPWPPEGVCG